MKAYPNPVSDYATIELSPYYLGSHLRLVNTRGASIAGIGFESNAIEARNEKYPPGVYLVSTFDGKPLTLVR